MASEAYLVKALYSFKGKNNDELCFKKGDIITVTQREEGGWWEGTLSETTGWFPNNYVVEYKEPSGSTTTSPVRAPSEIQAFRNVVLKDIIDSEKAHVAELQGLVLNFLHGLEKSNILTKDEFKQLTVNIGEILKTHEQLLGLIEECGAKSGPDQRVGGLFLQWAPQIKNVHQIYCAGHPRAVCILDKYKDELNSLMEQLGASCPGLLVLTAGLSKPFRRLGKYAAMLQELARHVHEAHPDRGDTHRAVAVYKEIAATCAAVRRQKELELQVVTGAVRGWPGSEAGAGISELGDVLHMGGVAVGEAHADRYLVLFPTSLLVLSVSRRMSAFVYEGCLPLTGIKVKKLEDTEVQKNAFEIGGPMIDTITAVCQTKAEADNWVELLQKYSNPGSILIDKSNGQPNSLPYSNISPADRRSIDRRSLYHVTLPPSTYPPASPYHSLTKYFAKLVRLRIITRSMLKKLLHERPWARHSDSYRVPYRRRQKPHLTLRMNVCENVETETETSSSETKSDESDSETSIDCSEIDETRRSCKMERQDALDLASHPSTSSHLSSNPGNLAGYMRYYNSSQEIDDHPNDSFGSSRLDCSTNSIDFIKVTKNDRLPELSLHNDVSVTLRDKITKYDTLKQTSNASDNSIEAAQIKSHTAFEDLVNIDENIAFQSLGKPNFGNMNLMRHSCPIKFVADKFNNSTLTSVGNSEWQSYTNDDLILHEDEPKGRKRVNGNLKGNKILKTLTDLEPIVKGENIHSYSLDFVNLCQDYEKTIIDPPPLFRNEFKPGLQHKFTINNENEQSHSSKIEDEVGADLNKDILDHSGSLRNSTLKSMIKGQYNKSCGCCLRSPCHSPRSSDSGVAGSCNLASPDIPTVSDCIVSSELIANDAKLDECNNYFSKRCSAYQQRNVRDELTLSDIEASKFEEQCQCTSPFGSTPRTSCQQSLTSENIIVGALDSTHTSVTSSYLVNPPVSTSQPWNTVNDLLHSRLENLNLKRQCSNSKNHENPKLYRKPSTHNYQARNVRDALCHGWSTSDINKIHSKPSNHYHLRIYKEPQNEEKPTERLSRTTKCYNHDKTPNYDCMSRSSRSQHRMRSRSEDMSKKFTSKETQTGFISPVGNTTQPNLSTNHKRSHSFNNHHSYTHHVQQSLPQAQQQNQYLKSQHQRNTTSNRLLSSCDSLSQTSSRLTGTFMVPKFLSVDYLDTSGTSGNMKGWALKNLRPAPPLRPQAPADTGSGADETSAPPYSYLPHQRKSNSYEEDALILRVIEAYCTSARSRNAVSSECDEDNHTSLSGDILVRSPSLPIHMNNQGPTSLWTVVMRLQSDMKLMKAQLKQLQIQLIDERQERTLSIATLQPHSRVLRDAKESNC